MFDGSNGILGFAYIVQEAVSLKETRNKVQAAAGGFGLRKPMVLF